MWRGWRESGRGVGRPSTGHSPLSRWPYSVHVWKPLQTSQTLCCLSCSSSPWHTWSGIFSAPLWPLIKKSHEKPRRYKHCRLAFQKRATVGYMLPGAHSSFWLLAFVLCLCFREKDLTAHQFKVIAWSEKTIFVWPCLFTSVDHELCTIIRWPQANIGDKSRKAGGKKVCTVFIGCLAQIRCICAHHRFLQGSPCHSHTTYCVYNLESLVKCLVMIG